MIHFDVVFNASWVIGLWIVCNINIDFNPICFSFEEYLELFIIKVQIYSLKRMTHFTERHTSYLMIPVSVDYVFGARWNVNDDDINNFFFTL